MGRTVQALLTVVALSLIAAQPQDAKLPQPTTESATPDSVVDPGSSSARAPEADPFGPEPGPKPAACTKNEGILDKLARLSSHVETMPDGTLWVAVWSGEITDDDLVALGTLANLGSLDVPGSRITDRGINGLAKSQSLFRLNLEKTGIADEGVKALVKLPELRSLNLAGTKITDAGVVSLKRHASLRELDLSDTSVSNAAIESLSGNEQLTSLDISGTCVDDAAMLHIGKLRHLRVLHVNKTISNEALAAIEGLVELNDFSGPAQITDIGLHHLRNLTNMGRIGGVMSQVTDSGLRSIRACPSLDISALTTARLPMRG